MASSPKRFSIALSYPGEYRPFVGDVASQLAEHVGRDRVLYDRFYEAEFARPGLDAYLQHLYHDESVLIAVFLSAEYESKDWCGLEWRVVRDLIKRRQPSTVMIFRFDMTEVPGLFSIDGYVWIGDRKPEDVASLIQERFRSLAGTSPTQGILKKALVIQSIGQADNRERNGRVFGELIRPACAAAGFDADEAGNYSPESMRKPISSPLFRHPMVVADLGNLSTGSPNTLIDVGFRLSTGRPILCFADKPLPVDIPSHLPAKGEILEIDPGNPRASLKELASRIGESFARGKEEGPEQGWASEHPLVDWQLAMEENKISRYLYANDKAAALYGLASVDEIIGHPVDDVDNQLYALMDPAYTAPFLEEQKKMILSIIDKRRVLQKQALNTAATYPLIFSQHPMISDLRNEIYLPVIANYKYDKSSESYVFRTVFLRIGQWAAKDFSERSVEDRRIPALFRKIYEYDFFLCYDTADFDQAETLKIGLTRIGFKVWWPDNHNSNIDADLPAPSLKAELAKARIAAVLVGSRDRGRWGKPDLDNALYKHCEAQKPLILFLLPIVSGLEPTLNDWLGQPYKRLLGNPLYVKWPSVMELLSNATSQLGPMPSNSLSRIFREILKLLHLPVG
jgi:hypothetical protein